MSDEGYLIGFILAILIPLAIEFILKRNEKSDSIFKR